MAVRLTLDGKGSAERVLGMLRDLAEAEGFTLEVSKGSTCAKHGVALTCPSCTGAAGGRKNKGRTVSPERAAQLREIASRPRRKRSEGAKA
jgi:hypothetical protein